MPIQPSKHRRGFTLTEMLVVIGIIALVASITLVVLGKARKSADKSRLAFQLQTISVGLDSYQSDFNSMPMTVLDNPAITYDNEINRDGVRGARILCKALMGATGSMNPVVPTAGSNFPLDKAHQDGKSGLGFAVPGRSGIAVTVDTDGNLKGKSYGPYLAADKFALSRTNDDGTPQPAPFSATEKYDDTTVLLDGNNSPILYYPVQNAQAPTQLQFAYLAKGHSTVVITSPLEVTPPPPDPVPFVGTPMFLSNDNSCWLAPPLMRLLTGDSSGDARINAGETAANRGKYILWTAGPDGIFGPDTKNGTVSVADALKRGQYDDVTNFQGQ